MKLQECLIIIYQGTDGVVNKQGHTYSLYVLRKLGIGTIQELYPKLLARGMNSCFAQQIEKNCTAQSKASQFVGQSRNSYLAQGK